VHEFAKLPEIDRGNVFRATAEARSIHEAIIEKDFWVCWVIDYLFHDSPWNDKITFKGGTSLSKAYGAIRRFSEDVDLVIDWSLIGYTEDEAFTARSSKKQDKFCDEASRRTVRFLETKFLPMIEKDLCERLGMNLEITQDDHAISIGYPKSFKNQSIQPKIVLEIGPKALHGPNEQKVIQSYAAEAYPAQFKTPSTEARTVSAERSFWEKATILHQEAHRSTEKTIPLRYSRHYYDLYQLSKTDILEKALDQIDLLSGVTQFKMKFFRCGWAKYEEAKPGTLRLLPPDNRINDLKNDYNSMKAMIFEPIPSFEEIIEGIEALEKKINNLNA